MITLLEPGTVAIGIHRNVLTRFSARAGVRGIQVAFSFLEPQVGADGGS